MNKDDEQFLKDFYQAVTERPLELDDTPYVPHDEGDEVDPAQALARGIEWTPGQSVQLLSGFRGAGKTKTLRHLYHRLKDADCEVVLCDPNDHLEFSAMIEVDEFLMSIVKSFLDSTKRSWKPPPVTVSDREGRLRQVTNNIHAFFEGIDKEGRSLVLLVDSIKKARDVYLGRIFLSRASKLHLPGVHVVYTVPPLLALRNSTLGSLYSPGGVFLIPHSTPKFLVKVAEKSDDWRRLLGNENSLHVLIQNSAGIPAMLFRLLAEIIRRSHRLPVSGDLIQAVIDSMRQELLPLTDEDVLRLRHVAETRRLPLDDSGAMRELVRLLDNFQIVAYQDTGIYFDVHPLIKGVIQEQPAKDTWTPAEHGEDEEWFAEERDTARINALVLEDVCAFERLRLEFPNQEGEGQWAVLLGDNGVGKSTVLRALALAAVEPATATYFLEMRSSAAPFVRVGLDGAKVELDLSTGAFEVRIRKSSLGSEGMQARTRNGTIRPPVFAYGCQRGTALGGPERDVTFRPIDDVGSLFDYNAHLIHAETWIRRIQSAALCDSGGPAETFFDAVGKTLVAVLNGVESLEVRSDQIWLQGPNVGEVPLAAMSDGYVTTAGWVIDLIARWADRYTRAGGKLDDDFSKQMTGLVLVDEIDLHLHPLWQLEIVSSLRESFPRLSFLVTTHNPLTLLGAKPGEIHVLRRDEDDRIVTFQRDIPPGTRADEVLTGFWFNLPSTLDQGTLDLFEEHRGLLREGVDEEDPRLKALEKKLRERLGTFADTSYDRMALRIAAKAMDEEAQSYKEVSPERRQEIREEILAELSKAGEH